MNLNKIVLFIMLFGYNLQVPSNSIFIQNKDV